MTSRPLVPDTVQASLPVWSTFAFLPATVASMSWTWRPKSRILYEPGTQAAMRNVRGVSSVAGKVCVTRTRWLPGSVQSKVQRTLIGLGPGRPT